MFTNQKSRPFRELLWVQAQRAGPVSLPALEEQSGQADISQLDFESRLGLLVERQWLWKENRAFATRLRYAQLKIAAALEDIDYRHPRGLKRAQIDQLRASDWN